MLLLAGFGKKEDFADWILQFQVCCGQSPPAHGTDTDLAPAPLAGPAVVPIPVMWPWLPLPILPLGGSMARPPAWAASPFSRTIKSELLFPEGERKL